MIEFVLLWDSSYGRRSGRVTHYNKQRFQKVNHALDELRKEKFAHRLVVVKDHKTSTMFHFRGPGSKPFVERKAKSLIQVGENLYLTKMYFRKTTRKRKCVQSNDSPKTNT